jgi:prepilin-type N-terminal cleavage/methylation domain-containing protein
MWQSADCEEGFSLVEVMTAMAIAAIAIVALYRGITQSSRAAQMMEERFAATLLARSLIDDALESPIKGGLSRDGAQGGLRWTLDASAADGTVAAQAPRGMTLYDVRVTVTWAPRGSLTLSSLALGR